ncbi:deoxynucleoside kinase [Cyclobacterium amurskyense]|jgi:deoxyadenosine/deoxycytidine kinase|uniref:deoxynucleoside kinase n=1 Tax=Cyclobacterium amurskyense TaxID=320787 RepID=UPI0030DC5F96|tara:strand:+ start:17384 stop:18001 length:618 start_codon:yes stop_codon:yes gene_type:complete
MHIAISGNIGSGKTSLAVKLAAHYGWQTEFESVEDNPYLSDFYKDMTKWSFHLQVFFLQSRINQVKRIQQNPTSTIQDRTIYEDAHIFAANLYESNLISKRDYENYKGLYHSMANYIKPPDLLIYLKADIPKLVDQIEKRGRNYERSIQIAYLKNLNDLYQKWITEYNLGKLLVIDVNNMNFVDNPEDFSIIVEKIDGELFGLFN